MARALFIAAFFFTMTPLLISVQWLLEKFKFARLGFYRVELLSCAVFTVAYTRADQR